MRSDVKKQVAPQTSKKEITVTLKLFNTIALARGEDLLRKGVTLTSKSILTTLTKRPQLLENMINIQMSDKEIDRAHLLTILQETEKITLTFGTQDA